MEGGQSGFQRFTLPAWVEERDSGIHEKIDYELFPGYFRENSHGNGARGRCFCYAVNLMSEFPDNPFTPGIGEFPPVKGHRPEVETHLLRMLRELRKGRAHAKFAMEVSLHLRQKGFDGCRIWRMPNERRHADQRLRAT